MKRIAGILIIAIVPLTATAQSNFPWLNSNNNMEAFRICASIFVLALVMIFILAILKRILEFRIKNRIVEKGVNENLASFILKPAKEEDGTINFKWFSI